MRYTLRITTAPASALVKRLLAFFAAALLVYAGDISPAHSQVASPGFAVIIGNRDYTTTHVPQVDYAHRDGLAFKYFLINVLRFDPMNIIELWDASYGTLESTFGTEKDHKSRLWSYLDPTAPADVLVFYSGHGVPGKDRRRYLLPSDQDPTDPDFRGYPLDLLQRNLAQLDYAQSVTLFLDACFSGTSHRGPLFTSASPAYRTDSPGSTTNVTVLSASGPMEVASWDESNRHGLFTHHLLDALYGRGDQNSDGRVTALEVKNYLDDHMTRAAMRLFKRRQNATLVGNDEVVLAQAPKAGYPDRPVIDEQGLRSFRDCSHCPEMVVVPAGSYRRGSPLTEHARQPDEGPIRNVAIDMPFGVGVYEVTFAEWQHCLDNNGCHDHRPPDEGWNGDTRPVINVSWDDAKAYVSWLSDYTNKQYRLLSETEWEYVARAGTDSPFHFGVTISAGRANYNGTHTYGSESRGPNLRQTTVVGHYRDLGKNGFGLHDVHGNVYEWVEDCWNGDYQGASGTSNAREDGECHHRVIRGGSWADEPWLLRSANREWNPKDLRTYTVGFRVAQTLD